MNSVWLPSASLQVVALVPLAGCVVGLHVGLKAKVGAAAVTVTVLEMVVEPAPLSTTSMRYVPGLFHVMLVVSPLGLLKVGLP